MFKYQRVKDLREDKDFTQKQIAKLLKEHLTTYRRWESGETEIPTHIIIKLCKIYNVTSDYILGIENQQKIEKIEIIGRDLKIL